MQKVNYVKTVAGVVTVPLINNSAYVTSLMVMCSAGPQGLKIVDTAGNTLLPNTTFNPPVVGTDGTLKPNLFVEYQNDQAMMQGGVNAVGSGTGSVTVWITAAKSVDSP